MEHKEKATRQDVEKKIQELLDVIEDYGGEDVGYVLNYLELPQGRGRLLMVSIVDEVRKKE